MNPRKILLLEDDPSLGESIKDRLARENYHITWCASLAEARTSLQDSQKHFDLLILDLGLPDGSGFEIAKEQQGRHPVIFLTALNNAEYRLKGYELGASEYIPKPFHLKELLILVEKTVQEQSAKVTARTSVHTYDEVKIDSVSMTIESDGQLFYPSVRDFAVLMHLIDSYPAAVSREELLNKHWGNDSFPTNRTVDNSVLRIRQFLGSKSNHYIKSVRGIGYQWIKEEKL